MLKVPLIIGHFLTFLSGNITRSYHGGYGTPWYIPPPYHGGYGTPGYIPPPYHGGYTYTLVYTTLYTPGYTLYTLCTRHSTGSSGLGVMLRRDEALGSEEEKPVGRSLCAS